MEKAKLNQETENKMNMSIPIFTVFISGIFGLLVAIVTWVLANMREKSKFRQELLYRDFKDKESFYLETLASLDKSIRFTKLGKDYSEMIDELTLNSARTNVYGSNKVNDKLVEVSEKLFEWSSEYRKSLPQKISETDFALVSTENYKYKEKANNIFPDLIVLIQELTIEIRSELKEMKKQIVI